MTVSILADNQFITRTGIKSLLQQRGTGEIFEAANTEKLQELLTKYPDASVILDYTQFDFQSADQLLNMRNFALSSRWLLFSEELSPFFIRNILISDPEISVVMKGDTQREIDSALDAIGKGNVYVCDSARQLMKEKNINPTTELTASEKLVLHEIALGKTTKEIAYEKNLSFHTVNTHRKNIFRKIEVNNVHEAIRYAVRAGIFDVAEYYI